MLWLKGLHLIFMTSWFAGLFYLPRILVNLAMVPEASTAERARLMLMARKLYRFMAPLMVLTLGFGIALWVFYARHGVELGHWMHLKLTLVALLIGYHHVCGTHIKRFARGENRRSHLWFRVFNEVPVLILSAVVLLAVLKPF
jgi:putative membrane protein